MRTASSARSVGASSTLSMAIRRCRVSQMGPRGVGRRPSPISAPSRSKPSTRRRRRHLVSNARPHPPLPLVRRIAKGGVIPILTTKIFPPPRHPLPVAASDHTGSGGTGVLLAPALAALGCPPPCDSTTSASPSPCAMARWPLGRRRRRRRGSRLRKWLRTVASINAAISIGHP